MSLNRFSAPLAEAKYSWLKTVLDAYYISDVQVADQLTRQARKGIVPACHKGCSNCCLRATIPFAAPELATISWYVSEELKGETRTVVKQRLREHETRTECPFLVEGACTIYPVRPLACRQFLVKGQPCGPEENILDTRPQDWINLPRDQVARPVAMRMLDYWNLGSPTKKRKAFESGFFLQQTKNMHEFDWNIVADTMDKFDGQASQA